MSGPRLRQADTIQQLTGLEFREDYLSAARQKLISALESCLTSPFSDAMDGVIGACKIADFRLWPHQLDDEEVFGDEDVVTLIHHFQPILENAGVGIHAAGEEWSQLKLTVYKSFKNVHDVPSWRVVYPKCKGFDNILPVIDLVLTLPSHSADAERGFSEMKLIKTNWRSCLRSDVLSDLLFILFHSADIQNFDLTSVINKWNTVGARKEATSTSIV